MNWASVFASRSAPPPPVPLIRKLLCPRAGTLLARRLHMMHSGCMGGDRRKHLLETSWLTPYFSPPCNNKPPPTNASPTLLKVNLLVSFLLPTRSICSKSNATATTHKQKSFRRHSRSPVPACMQLLWGCGKGKKANVGRHLHGGGRGDEGVCVQCRSVERVRVGESGCGRRRGRVTRSSGLVSLTLPLPLPLPTPSALYPLPLSRRRSSVNIPLLLFAVSLTKGCFETGGESCMN